MILRRSDALSFSARLIAVTLIILGLALDVVWAGRTLHDQPRTHRHSGGANDQKTNPEHPVDPLVVAHLICTTI